MSFCFSERANTFPAKIMHVCRSAIFLTSSEKTHLVMKEGGNGLSFMIRNLTNNPVKLEENGKLISRYLFVSLWKIIESVSV